MAGYQTLIVWQQSIAVAEEIYRLTGLYPDKERYGLVSQMRRASVSIPSNIAEGYRRCHKKAFKQFLRVAFGSAAELETQIILSKKLQMAPMEEFQKVEVLLERVLRLLNGFHLSIL
jgi:four helix bundle protein